MQVQFRFIRSNALRYLTKNAHSRLSGKDVLVNGYDSFVRRVVKKHLKSVVMKNSMNCKTVEGLT